MLLTNRQEEQGMGYWAQNDVDTLLRRARDRGRRIFRSAVGWHPLTRGGRTMGSHESRNAAEDALREHIEDTVVPGRARERR